MRFFLSSFLLSIVVGLTTATLPLYGNPSSKTIDNVKADSPLGSKLISSARRLENDDEIDMSWVVDYSIKFQGCHHVSQWNDDAEDNDQVRIQTKRLIRFRLCPVDSCTLSSSSGCSSGYGDYIIDMSTFLQLYFEAVEEQNQYMCEYTQNTVCYYCENQEYGDDYTQDMCLYDCYVKQGVADICAENNPYDNNNNNNNNNNQDQFQLKDYIACKEADLNVERRHRQLDEEQQDADENADADADQEEQAEEQQQGDDYYQQQQGDVEYFVGPYCAEQGGAINLGLFLDDTCTTFADEKGGSYTYATLSGSSLPYAEKSIITNDCMSCQAVNDGDNDNNNNNGNAQVSEMCEAIYDSAGKCESQLYSSGVVYEANENACNYIKGIKVVRKDGIITQVGSKANKTASIFIGIFVVAFVLLAAYVHYLKTKLDRVSINLAE